MTVWLNLGESFAHILKSPDQRNWESTSWFLPSHQIKQGFRAAKDTLEISQGKILVSTRVSQTILGKRAGSAIALIVTSGFEDWPRIRQPIATPNLSIRSKRSRPLVDPEMVFGISERIHADGSIDQDLDLSELELLASKFELNGIKAVAVGLLHSLVNSSHEKMIKKFLTERGFSVVCSHEVSAPGNEISRWWRAYLNAYLNSTFEELNMTLKELEEEIGVSFSYFDSQDEEFANSPSRYLDTHFGFQRFVGAAEGSSAVLYLGLENFSIIFPERETLPLPTDIGPVSIERKRSIDLSIQPTSAIETDSFGNGVFSEQNKGYEPGPISFGRGLQPLFVDLLFLKNPKIKTGPFENLIKPAVEDKISRIVNTYFSGDRDESCTPTDFLFQLALAEIAAQIAKQKIRELKVVGFFAPFLTPVLKEQLKGRVNLSESKNGLI